MIAYRINPDLISLERFWQLLRERKMLPGRVILQQQMEQRFEILHKAGISSLGTLLRVLGSGSKLEAFSGASGLGQEYLVLLKREAASYLARPFPLSTFPGVPFEFTEVMKTRGIANTRDFFERVQTGEQQRNVSRVTGIPVARLKEIHALCDLSRVTGVGAVFARILYETGIHSVGEVASTGAEQLYQRCMNVIETRGYAAGHFSEGDIRYCIEYARVVVEADAKAA
jgi:hypothetical protein